MVNHNTLFIVYKALNLTWTAAAGPLACGIPSLKMPVSVLTGFAAEASATHDTDVSPSVSRTRWNSLVLQSAASALRTRRSNATISSSLGSDACGAVRVSERSMHAKIWGSVTPLFPQLTCFLATASALRQNMVATARVRNQRH